MVLSKAHNEWLSRPDDERFWNLAEMHSVCDGYRQLATEEVGDWKNVKPILAPGEIIQFDIGDGRIVQPTNWSFGQMARRVGAPPNYLRKLPADLALNCLEHGFANQDLFEKKVKGGDDGETFETSGGSMALIHPVEGCDTPVLRGMTSPKYERIWNADITERLLDLAPEGWTPPPARPASTWRGGDTDPRARAATEDDCGPHTLIRPGEMISPAGLYASDHDMFAFLVRPDRVVDDGDGGLSRGFFISNSEVGSASLVVVTFLYKFSCGNHFIWGATEISEVRIRHQGKKAENWGEVMATVTDYADASADEDEKIIRVAQHQSLGEDKDSVLESVMAMARTGKIRTLRTKSVKAAQEIAATEKYGDPTTLWAVANGLTEHSQTIPFADKRNEIDRDAGKLLALAAN